ncbi:MAG TPA: cupin domain-containing protein [Verrucomicrobiae bacterium]|nr:cupin domain-containing protein [Verrucomicrobiae bacterium]
MPFEKVVMAEVPPFLDTCGEVRPVWRNNAASYARLTMPVGARTTPHKHLVTHEVYIMEKGIGLLILDGEEMEVRAGDLIEIPLGVVHQLINIGDEEIELGVLCEPPFSLQDVITE